MTDQFETGSHPTHQRVDIGNIASTASTIFVIIGFSFTWYSLVQEINTNGPHSSASAAIQAYPIISGLTVLFGSIALMSALMWAADFKKETTYSLIASLIVAIILFAILATMTLLGFFVSLYLIGVFFLEIIWPPLKENGLQSAFFATTSLAAVIAAYLAYRIRCKQRVMYGSMEMLFGVCTIAYSAFTAFSSSLASSHLEMSKTDAMQLAFQALAGVYIIVRGLNNVEDGLKRGPIELRQLYDWVKSFIRERYVFVWLDQRNQVSNDRR